MAGCERLSSARYVASKTLWTEVPRSPRLHDNTDGHDNQRIEQYADGQEHADPYMVQTKSHRDKYRPSCDKGELTHDKCHTVQDAVLADSTTHVATIP